MEVALIVEAGPEHIEVLVEADAEASVEQLLSAVSTRMNLPPDGRRLWQLERTNAVLEPSMTIGALRLRQGDRLTSSAVRRPAVHEAPTGWELVGVGGMVAGRRYPLSSGENIIGRPMGLAVRINDPSVSRKHASLQVSDAAVRIEDLGSKNGTSCEGRFLDGPENLPPGAVVQIGSALLALRRPTDPDKGSPGYSEGRVLFNRPPRVARLMKPQKVQLPSPPETPGKARLPLAAAIVPALMGGAMVLFTGQMFYLLMAGLSPVMAVFSFFEGKRTGKGAIRRKQELFDRSLARASGEVATAHQASVDGRRLAHPGPADLLEAARALTADLWAKRPSDEDFLTVRLGLADQATTVMLDGGEFRDEQQALTAESPRQKLRVEYGLDRLVPTVTSLRAGVLGLAGPTEAADGIARSVLVQLASQHSPRDVAIVALVEDSRVPAWEWLRWLPHTETLLTGQRSVSGSGDAPGLLDAVSEQLAVRLAEADQRFGANVARSASSIVLVVVGAVPVSRPALAQILADGPRVGITAVILADSDDELPGECAAIAMPTEDDDTWCLVATRTGDMIKAVVPDIVESSLALDVALALSAVRDVTARGSAGDLPNAVGIAEVLGEDIFDAQRIMRLWSTSASSEGLGAPIGVGPAGPFTLDLRRDGPHGLVAGMPGSGKSELLQTLVVSLAANHAPSRMTFVLVDYKGGAAFKDCVRLPHVVGFFTDLDGHLAHRALLSLNAELRRREAILRQFGAKDLPELEGRDPANAPANLLIVFDEFAFLKKEVPEFVDGVVDIAQRGRSLGVHLLLATQRPSGVVAANIQGNANLRIALRTVDDTDSNDVIDRVDAARIPKGLPGRAYVRTGHSECVPIQTAYAGQVRGAGPEQPEVNLQDFGFRPSRLRRVSRRPVDGGSTDLQRLATAIQAASRQAGIPTPPRPWLDPLSSVYPIDQLTKSGSDGAPASRLAVPVGVVDEPSRQRQGPWTMDLGTDGHLFVYGTAGSGKTTFLRTLGAQLASRLGPDDLNLYGLDFGSRGLRPLLALPACGGIVSGDEQERVQRLFAMAEGEVAVRQALLGDSGAASLDEYRRRYPDGAPPWIVILLDSYSGFTAAFEDVDHGELMDRLARLASDGRAVGIHLVITNDRRGGVPNGLTSVVAGRLVLRMADAEEYSWFGLGQAAKGATLVAGRGFLSDGGEVQVACVSHEHDGAAQSAALAALGRGLTLRFGPPRRPVPPVAVLPDRVERTTLPTAAAPLVVAAGLDAASMDVAWVRLDDVASFLVAGPDGSGRSTALQTLVNGLLDADSGIEAVLLAPRRSLMVDLGRWKQLARGRDACAALAADLVEMAQSGAASNEPLRTSPLLVVVDDGDELTEGTVASDLEKLIRLSRDGGVVVLATCQTHVAHRAFSGWLTEMKKAKHGLILMPDPEIDGELLGVRLPKRTGLTLPPGRGYLCRRGTVSLVQLAI